MLNTDTKNKPLYRLKWTYTKKMKQQTGNKRSIQFDTSNAETVKLFFRCNKIIGF